MATCLVLTVSPCVSASLADDFNALLELKKGFESPDPTLSSWNPSSGHDSVCSWCGIGCSRGRVVSIDLSALNLRGKVSSMAPGLDRVVKLDLSGNNFTGTIEMSNLQYLRFVNISSNQFCGGLGWNYSSLPNLESLDAYDNNFTAGLPVRLLALESLRWLDLGGNYFDGEIPISYGSLSGLEYLSLAGNNLQGRIPAELGNLTNLQEIYLGYFNAFEGGIPRELGRLINLVHLDLSSCGLDGGIPAELGNLKELDTMLLYGNDLSGRIPKRLGNLTNLVSLDLSNNALTGEISLELVSLKKLELFNLFMNRLHGSIPSFIASLPSLQTLQLWMNNFTGTIPENLGQNGNLQFLDLSMNKLTGTIPPNMCASNRLVILILMKNFLFGPIPKGLGSCGSLVRVRLGQNYLNGSIPENFLYLPQLNLVELQNNDLSGTLPENANFSSIPTMLGQINLSGNRLSGPLPLSLANFSSVQKLLLGSNQFSGSIPPAIGELGQLVKLDFSQNSLNGEIPSEIGRCNHLISLDLSQNRLSGPIPPEISGIHILSYLNVSHNCLNESIPAVIGNMKSLMTADFSFNDFSGILSDLGQFAFFNVTSFAGNHHLCGPLVSNPCAVIGGRTSSGACPSHFKLIFALGLLLCSLIFASAAVFKSRSFRRTSTASWKMTAFQKLHFTVSDILECVKDSNVIGRGGAGVVYYGKMPDGTEIAVKKLLSFGANSRDHGFRAEIQTLGNIRHRNIVRLLAFCSNKETNLLVYEYMRNGSLGESLHGKKGSPFLGWDRRYKVAIEAARGLCYLHHDCSPLIIHRDVKSNNILLNSSFEAHVADFGLAKYLPKGGASECMSAIAGSYGYIAPEYAYTLKVDEKSDVYSFGVVLLELITGRRPVGDFGEGLDIVQWCRSTTCSGKRDEVVRIVDAKLKAVPKEEAAHVFFVAMLCVQDNSVERPTMREVLQMLSEFRCHSSPDRRSPPSSLAVRNNKPKQAIGV
ncbi:hypothetical protein MLD38_013654 [Melastoma candidum]|uniref:Uncharacterized protein n=1 Tax=Melastoma candidum TaxID=119954 RepID=A0ACB9RBF4_9MYRT|nr:hypothetical protein MLD38_013654 [Melastoma candidum]